MPRKKGKGGFLQNIFGTQANVNNQVLPPINQADIDDVVKNAKIIGTSGSSYLEINLKQNQKIHALGGSMIYMTGNISMPEAKYDGFGKILAGENIFFQEYIGTNEGIGNSSSGMGTVSLGMDVPNDIIRIDIPLNTEFRLSKNTFLACTENIEISFTTQMKGIIDIGQGEGFLLPTAKCTKGTKGYIWLCAYGTFNSRKIEAGNSIILDNGIFLACDNTIQYEVVNIGRSLIGSFLNSEGFGMKFNGPCNIYTQSKSLIGLMDIIQSYISTESSGVAVFPNTGTSMGTTAPTTTTAATEGLNTAEGFDVAEGIEMEGGKNKRTTKKTITVKKLNDKTKKTNKSKKNEEKPKPKRKYVRNST
jgi:uncharacterized protein (AIM24 family)